jgi:hypothetical protein
MLLGFSHGDILSGGITSKRRLFIVTNFISSAALCSITGQIMYFSYPEKQQVKGEGGCSFRRIEQNPEVTIHSEGQTTEYKLRRKFKI